MLPSVERLPGAGSLPDRAERLAWAEAIVGPIFYDDDRARQLRECPEQLVESEVGMRAVILGIAYREIAIARYADRRSEIATATAEKRTFDSGAFTTAWGLSADHREAIRQDNDHPGSVVRAAARQLSIINSVESSAQDASGLRKRQEDIKHKLIARLEESPNLDEVLDPTAVFRRIAKGILVKSPTGTGKSAMEGDLVRSAGVGKPAAGPYHDPIRALYIVPSLALVGQTVGWRGKRTFQRFAGKDIDVTAKFFGYEDMTGDVVATTTSQVRKGAVAVTEFDIVIPDEVHHMLGEQLAAAHQQGELGPLVIGYTATAERGDGRHVRQLLPGEVDGGDIISCINEGVLNHAQLFSYRVPLDTLAPKGARHELLPQIIHGKATQEAIDMAAKLAATGRRVAIYGSPGGNSAHARYMADSLEGRVVTTPHGKEKVLSAKAVGKWASDEHNEGAMQGIDDRTLDIIAATEMLKEGWDADIDAVLIVRRGHSKLWTEQVIGRGTRLSEEFPTTIYMEWLLILEEEQKGLVSICDVFGEDEVEQGRIFGPSADERVGGQHSSHRNSSFEEGGPLRIEDLPADLQEYAKQIDHRLVREVTTVRWEPGSIEERLPGAISLEKIMEMPNIPDYAIPQHIARHLQGGSIRSIDQWEVNKESGRYRQVSYFAPEAVAYLEDKPIPSLQQLGELSPDGISELLMISIDFVRQKIQELELQGNERLSRGKTQYYGAEAIMAIKQEVDQLPHAEEGDVRVKDITTSLGSGRVFIYRFINDPENQITPAYKRYLVEETGRYRFGYHITEAEADKIWAAYYAMPDAEEGAMSVSEIAAEAGVAINVVRKAATVADEARAMWTWLPGRKEAPRLRFPHETVVRLIERVRKDPLPPQLIPLSFMDVFLPVGRSAFRRHLDGFRPVTLRLATGGRATCYEWGAFAHLIDRYGLAEDAPEVDVLRFPRTITDNDPDRLIYALSMQRAHLNAKIEVLELSAKVNALIRTENIPEVGAQGLTLIDPNSDVLDEHAIGERLGVQVERVRQAIADTTGIPGVLPPTSLLSSNRQLSPHFKGRQLEAIVVYLTGVNAEVAAQCLRVTPEGMRKFMHAKDFVPNAEGNYSLAAWEAARTGFAHVAAGYRELSEVAVAADREEAELWEFLETNGGRSVMRFNQEGDEKRYLDPHAVRLAIKQGQKHPKPPAESDFAVNREEVARLSRQLPSQFDDWLMHHPDAMRRVIWYEERDGTRVLPHIPYSYVRFYIDIAKRSAESHVKSSSDETVAPPA